MQGGLPLSLKCYFCSVVNNLQFAVDFFTGDSGLYLNLTKMALFLLGAQKKS